MPAVYVEFHFSHSELISKSNVGGSESPLGSLMDCMHTPFVQELLNNNLLFQKRDLTLEGM